jgi:hypothetical protein
MSIKLNSSDLFEFDAMETDFAGLAGGAQWHCFEAVVHQPKDAKKSPDLLNRALYTLRDDIIRHQLAVRDKGVDKIGKLGQAVKPFNCLPV